MANSFYKGGLKLSYGNVSIIKDVNNQPVPQYWNPNSQNYEVVEGSNGCLKVIMVDSNGNEIQTQSLIDQISDKLDELIEVVG